MKIGEVLIYIPSAKMHRGSMSLKFKDGKQVFTRRAKKEFQANLNRKACYILPITSTGFQYNSDSSKSYYEWITSLVSDITGEKSVKSEDYKAPSYVEMLKSYKESI